MTSADLSTCHCIIGHPSKPKFLVVKHAQGWQPPSLKFPLGNADYKAGMINDGMLNKYGLQTRVVRPLLRTANYHCLELELASPARSRKIEAVWADREQYLRGRRDWGGQVDPFEQWLLERESGAVPRLRPPWHVPGWFGKADSWIHHQLDSLGVQVTGGVQQHRVGWNASCVLRVMSSEGLIYFKAGYAKPPGEAQLTVALAKKFPRYIIPPLAADAQRNWMLNRDFSHENDHRPDVASLPGFARAMADLQIESARCMDEWEGLGCPRHDLTYLLSLVERKEALLSPLGEGKAPIGDHELQQLVVWLEGQAGLIRQLQSYAIPDTLVHLDFRRDSLVVRGADSGIMDWADVVIGHPFQVLKPIYGEAAAASRDPARKGPQIGRQLLGEITQSYLEAFLPFAPAEGLERAMGLARRLFYLWNYVGYWHELDWTEKNTPSYLKLIKLMRNTLNTVLPAKPL